MSDTFVYTTPLDPRAKPLIDELTYEYDSRYGSYFNAAGAVEEMNRYPAEAFAPPHGNFPPPGALHSRWPQAGDRSGRRLCRRGGIFPGAKR